MVREILLTPLYPTPLALRRKLCDAVVILEMFGKDLHLVSGGVYSFALYITQKRAHPRVFRRCV
jgi:hypothetical protein